MGNRKKKNRPYQKKFQRYNRGGKIKWKCLKI